MDVQTGRMLSAVEVARRLGVEVSHVYRLIFAGDLRGGPTSERVVRVRESDLQAYLRRRDA
ncbi:MAG: helix-turn-helix domain-containing protein [Actinobacteria bacterium]|nr:helix-turn-helix domain-containing protein [Actinomycetota bacterium]